MTEDKLWYLKQVNLFEGVADMEIMKIATQLREKRCKKKELLYTPEQTADNIYVLKKGKVNFYYLHHGKKLIIDSLSSGSIFGNINFNDKDEKNTHFAEIAEDSYICVFTVSDFLKIIQAKPEIMIRFLKIMSARLTEYEHKMKAPILDAKEKILYALETLKRDNNKSFLSKLFNPAERVTHEKLSNLTGLSRETVTRSISDLRKTKMISVNENNEIILNM